MQIDYKWLGELLRLGNVLESVSVVGYMLWTWLILTGVNSIAGKLFFKISALKGRWKPAWVWFSYSRWIFLWVICLCHLSWLLTLICASVSRDHYSPPCPYHPLVSRESEASHGITAVWIPFSLLQSASPDALKWPKTTILFISPWVFIWLHMIMSDAH